MCLGRSDHEPFWDARLPAAVLTDGAIYDGYPCYHKPCDTVDKLNISCPCSTIQLTAAGQPQRPRCSPPHRAEGTKRPRSLGASP